MAVHQSQQRNRPRHIPGEEVFVHTTRFDLTMPNAPISYPKTLIYPLPAERHSAAHVTALQILQQDYLYTPCDLGISITDLFAHPDLHKRVQDASQDLDQVELDPLDQMLIDEAVPVDDLLAQEDVQWYKKSPIKTNPEIHQRHPVRAPKSALARSEGAAVQNEDIMKHPIFKLLEFEKTEDNKKSDLGKLKQAVEETFVDAKYLADELVQHPVRKTGVKRVYNLIPHASTMGKLNYTVFTTSQAIQKDEAFKYDDKITQVFVVQNDSQKTATMQLYSGAPEEQAKNADAGDAQAPPDNRQSLNLKSDTEYTFSRAEYKGYVLVRPRDKNVFYYERITETRQLEKLHREKLKTDFQNGEDEEQVQPKKKNINLRKQSNVKPEVNEQEEQEAAHDEKNSVARSRSRSRSRSGSRDSLMEIEDDNKDKKKSERHKKKDKHKHNKKKKLSKRDKLRKEDSDKDDVSSLKSPKADNGAEDAPNNNAPEDDGKIEAERPQDDDSEGEEQFDLGKNMPETFRRPQKQSEVLREVVSEKSAPKEAEKDGV